MTLPGGHFVESGGRRKESLTGLGKIGIDATRQFYLDLADGELNRPAATSLLTRAICGVVLHYGINRLVTLGDDGFDGHTDHMAAFGATIAAATMLSPSLASVDVQALNARHDGEYVVTGNPLSKLAAMAVHASQFAMDKSDFWTEFPINYGSLFVAETYDIVKLTQG